MKLVTVRLFWFAIQTRKSSMNRIAYERFLALLLAALVPSAVSAQSLPAPQITQPQASVAHAGIPTMRWGNVSGAQSYRICYRLHSTQPCSIEAVRTTTNSGNYQIANYPTLRGARVEGAVAACGASNGTNCGDLATRTFYILGGPVSLTSPADGATHASPPRQPSFQWQAYNGFHANASSGTVNYTVNVNAFAAPPLQFSTTGTQFQLPNPLPTEYGSEITWNVIACNNVNCSGGGSRKLTLAGTVSVSQPPLLAPANNATVQAQNLVLEWGRIANATFYYVYVRPTPPVGGQLGNLLASVPQTASGNPQHQVQADASFMATYAGKTMYWTVVACAGQICSTPGPANYRAVNVAAPPGASPPPTREGGTGPANQFSWTVNPIAATDVVNYSLHAEATDRKLRDGVHGLYRLRSDGMLCTACHNGARNAPPPNLTNISKDAFCNRIGTFQNSDKPPNLKNLFGNWASRTCPE